MVMRGPLVALVACLVAAACIVGWPSPGGVPDARALTSCDTATAAEDATEAQVMALVNAHRAAAGLSALKTSPSLARAAAWKSEDRSTSIGAGLSHTDSLGRSPATRAGQCGYPSWVGENVAYGYPTPASVVEAWMGSAGHRANILKSSYAVAGVGYSAGAWTMDFGDLNDSGVSAPPASATSTPTRTPTSTPTSTVPAATSTPTVTPSLTATPPGTPEPEATTAPAEVLMELRAGVNLVTYVGSPMPADTALAGLGLLETLWSWNADVGAWEAWQPGEAGQAVLYPGRAYFIRVSRDTTWSYQSE